MVDKRYRQDGALPQVREGQEAGRKAQGFRQAGEAWGGWG